MLIRLSVIVVIALLLSGCLFEGAIDSRTFDSPEAGIYWILGYLVIALAVVVVLQQGIPWVLEKPKPKPTEVTNYTRNLKASIEQCRRNALRLDEVELLKLKTAACQQMLKD